MRHCLLLADIAHLWLAGLNIGWGMPPSQWILGSCDRWEFPAFFIGYWQSPYTALTAGKCLPLGLCKETVKESIWIQNTRYSPHPLYYFGSVSEGRAFSLESIAEANSWAKLLALFVLSSIMIHLFSCSFTNGFPISNSNPDLITVNRDIKYLTLMCRIVLKKI